MLNEPYAQKAVDHARSAETHLSNYRQSGDESQKTAAEIHVQIAQVYATLAAGGRK